MDYFDCHADTLTKISLAEDLWENTCDLDLKRVRGFASRYTQIMAIWQDCQKNPRKQLEDSFMQLYQRAAALLQGQHTRLAWCKNAADMQAAHQEGKAAVFLSVEDVSAMGSLAGRIKEMGIRFAMLTWNYENAYACGAVASQSRGLTKKGRELVRQLTGEQIILDISHLSDQGVEDILNLTDRPVMASHSNIRAVCGHPRNLTNAHVRELVRRNGLIGLNFYGHFVGHRPKMADLLRHVDAVLALGGEDNLAIGSDFDGCDGIFPQGITGVESILGFRQILEQAGFGESLIQKLFFENAYQFVLQNLGT